MYYQKTQFALLGVFAIFVLAGPPRLARAESLDQATHLYRTGDCGDTTIKSLQEAVATDPAMNLSLGRCYAETGANRKAIDPLLVALRDSPADTRALHLLVAVYTKLGLHDEARNLVHGYVVQHPDSLEATVESGRLQLAAGDKEAAAATFRSVLEKSPEFPSALLGLGLVAIKDQQWNEALEDFAHAKQIASGAAEIYAATGDVYALQGNCEAAISPYSQAFEIRPSDFGTAKSLAKCYAQLGKQDEVARVLQSGTLAEARDPEATMMVATALKSDPKAAGEYLRNVIELNPENVVARKLRAETLETSHNLDQAEAEYREILKLQADHPDPVICSKLASIEESKKEFEDARKHYEIAANAPGATAEMRLGLPRVELALKDTAAAQVEMNKMADAVKQTPEFQLLQLEIYVASGQNDSAATLANECLARSPNDSKVIGLAATAAHNQQRFEDEAALVERLYQAAPDDKDLRYRLVRIYVQHPELKKNDRVLELLNNFVSHQEVDPEGYLLLAFLYQGNNDPANAKTYFDLGFSHMPTPVPARFSWAYGSYANFLAGQHDLEGALASQQRALELNPTDEKGEYNLGVLYSELGRIDAAEEALSKLQAMNSELAADLEAIIRNKSRKGKGGAQ